MTYICGIDEAGRGPVIGPLVMCGFCITSDQEGILRELGVADSKTLSPTQREEIAKKLKILFKKYAIFVIDSKEIDARGSVGLNLNDLEAKYSALIINQLHPHSVILDCPAANPQNYVAGLQKWLTHKVNIRAEYKADANHLVVGAASILAKVERDHQIQLLKEKIGADFGSGYPSDPTTQAFLKAHYKEYDIFRKTWESYKAVAQSGSQKDITHFFTGQQQNKTV